MSRSIAVLLLSGMALTGAPATAGAQAQPPAKTPSVAKPALELLGPSDKPRTISVTRRKEGQTYELVGELSLLVRNPGKTATLRTAYYRDDGAQAIRAPGTGNAKGSVSMELVAADGTVLTSAPKLDSDGLRQLNLRFTMDDDAAPDALNGTLAVVPTRKEAGGDKTPVPRPGERVVVAVAGAAKQLDGVAVEPEKLTVHVTCWVPVIWVGCVGDGKVNLEGAGVGDALRDLKAAGAETQSIPLSGGGNSGTTVTFTDLTPEEGNPNRATARVAREGDPQAGAYEGKAELSPLMTGAPALALALDSKLSFAWAVALIALGVGLAAILTHRLGLLRRKSLIHAALKDSAENYSKELEARKDGSELELVWSLESVVEHVDGKPVLEDKKWKYFQPLDSVGRVGSAIRWARNDADLDEAQAAAFLMIERISNWRLIVAEICRLKDLKSTAPQNAMCKGVVWNTTAAACDTAVALQAIWREPKDATAAAALHERMCRQATWHRALGYAWDLYNVIERDPVGKASLGSYDLGSFVNPPKSIAERTTEEQDEIFYELSIQYAGLHVIAESRGLADGFPCELSYKLPPKLEELNRTVAIMSAYPDRQRAGFRTLILTRSARTDPPEGEDPAVAREGDGNEDLDSRSESTDLTSSADGSQVGFFKQLLLRDTLLSIVIVVLTSIGYAATVYDSTWGSLLDMATALAAGFTGQVAIKWAALPLYRSIRLRPAKPAPAPATAQ